MSDALVHEMGCGASAARLVDAPREADQLASEEIASKEHAAGAVEGRRDTSLEEKLPLIQTAAAAPDFAKLITEPPQQKLELSDTNKCTPRQTACIPLCRVRCVCRRLTRRLPAAADSWAGATETQERDLVVALAKLPDMIELFCETLMPHHICAYLYELAGKISAFTRDCRVLGSDKEDARLVLCEASAVTMRTCLNMLGIEAPMRL